MAPRIALLCLCTACTYGGPIRPTCPTVRVSEVMTSSEEYERVDGDWFELENPGPESIDLSGLRLARRRTDAWRIPDGTSLDAGAFLYFRASPYDEPDSEVPTVGFDFNEDSESLQVYAADGQAVCDEVHIPPSHDDFTWQLNPDYDGDPTVSDAWCFAVEPSPGEPNATCLCAVPGAC